MALSEHEKEVLQALLTIRQECRIDRKCEECPLGNENSECRVTMHSPCYWKILNIDEANKPTKLFK